MARPRRYSKSVGDIIKIKTDFFEKNEEMLKLSAHQADALLLQPKRTKCKICHGPIGEDAGQRVLYTSQRMRYFDCPVCGHVNSEYEDTDDFASRVYISDNYLANYSEDDRQKYETRRDTIYIPKAQFLLDALAKDGLDKKEIKLLDDGAGSGYFVSAIRQLGVEQADGIEISEPQVQFAHPLHNAQVLDIESLYLVRQHVVVVTLALFETLAGVGREFSGNRIDLLLHFLYLRVREPLQAERQSFQQLAFNIVILVFLLIVSHLKKMVMLICINCKNTKKNYIFVAVLE